MRGAWLPMLLAPLAVLGPDQRPTDLGPQSYGLVPAYRDGVEAEVAAPRELNRVSHAASNGPVVGSGSEAPSAVVENAQLMASTSLPTKVPVHWDRAVEVAWGKPGDRRVIAYFHGMCGDITAFRSFASVAQEHGTLIAVPADTPCENQPGRFKWSANLGGTNRRILAAIEAVSRLRGEPLDGDHVTVMGYSQGSSHAAALARQFPERYPRLVLAAGPTKPRVPRDARVLVLGGTLDLNAHLREGTQDLLNDGVKARFLALPGAHHGEYGGDAPKVMAEGFDWLDGAP